MAESEEELQSRLMKVKGVKKGQSEKVQAPHSKSTDHGVWSHKFMANNGETVETMRVFIFGGSKITADGDCSHEIKRCLLLGRKALTNLLLLLSYFSCVQLCATP